MVKKSRDYGEVYFSQQELACRCEYEDCDAKPFSLLLLEIMNSLRRDYGKPIYVTSARRCKKHNQDVGGSPKSQHLQGKAIDIIMPEEDMYEFIVNCNAYGIRAIGIGPGWMHLDIRNGTPTSWVY